MKPKEKIAHTSPSADLEELLRRHLPEDSNDAITDYVVNEWKSKLANAETVVVEWTDSYRRKLNASWLDHNGRVLVSTARPPGRAGSVREFVRDWEQYMENRGLMHRVDWKDSTGPGS
jgi:hypothetical protein